MDTAWIHFCVLAIVTSVTYSTKQKTEGDSRQQLSKLTSHNDNVTKYIDLSVSLLGQNLGQHKQIIIDTITNVDEAFQKQLNTSVILSNLQTIAMPSALETSSSEDAIRTFKLLTNNSESDSAFLIRSFSSPSVESTFDTMCSGSFTGGVINVVTMDDASALARQFMYGLGRNLGFDDLKNSSDSCKCHAQDVCMMASTSSSENPLKISVSSCNINKFNQRDNSCLIDQPSQLPDPVTCGNGVVDSGEQCDCLQDDLECKQCCDNCLYRTGAVCSSGPCCSDCQIQKNDQHTLDCAGDQLGRGCNSWDCICRHVIGKGAIAASTECIDQLQANASSAFCGITRNCSRPILDTECDIVLCRADEVALQVPESIKVANVSIAGSPKCSNLYAVGSAATDGSSLTDGIVCKVNGVCVSGKCDTSCNDKNGRSCSNNGDCDKTNKCLCNCGWSGRLCNIPDSKKECSRSPSNKQDDATHTTTGVQTTHIIAVFIGIVFAAAIVSGATSFGYKRLQKRNRLQTKHERNMLSLFEPTKQQKKRLARHCNKHSDQNFHYNERYRIPTNTNAEQRLMDEGMPPPILCTAAKHSSRDVSI